MSQMNQRIDNYQGVMAPSHCAEATSGLGFANSDYGIMTNVNCAITCRSGAKSSQLVPASFIPSSYGLTPGDGSNQQNTLWRSVGVTIKVWSEEVCLQLGSETCKGLDNVADSVVKKISSGDWSIDHAPGCDEKVPMLSPFDNTVKSNKIPAPLIKQLEIGNISQSIKVFDQIHQAAIVVRPSKICKHRMNTSLCFGDCVHEITKGGDWKETLASPEPLAREKSSWCMDGFVEIIKKNKKLSKSVQVKACEAFLWSNMMHANDSGSSCAALRGNHECLKLVNALSDNN
jgi:hypothetical protein